MCGLPWKAVGVSGFEPPTFRHGVIQLRGGGGTARRAPTGGMSIEWLQDLVDWHFRQVIL